MYWNKSSSDRPFLWGLLNSNIRCIEITFDKAQRKETYPLNSNIRCIEISFRLFPAPVHPGWIVTLDVLKWYFEFLYKNSSKLNSNIRCIEIRKNTSGVSGVSCWIVTLDVLKFLWIPPSYWPLVSWIVTLDVLK